VKSSPTKPPGEVARPPQTGSSLRSERPGSPRGQAVTPHPQQGVPNPRRTGQVTHDAQGHAVWQWAADTARQVALSASQVLRKLDPGGLSLMDESSGKRQRMPGGAFNPYESSRPAVRKSPGVHRAAQPTRASAAGPRAPVPAPRTRSPWWRRLFGGR